MLAEWTSEILSLSLSLSLSLFLSQTTGAKDTKPPPPEFYALSQKADMMMHEHVMWGLLCRMEAKNRLIR